MNLPNLNTIECSLDERCGLITALRRSLRYLHHCYLQVAGDASNTRSQDYWLGEIRVAYRLYRQLDFDAKIRPDDRYAGLTQYTTKEHI